MALKPTIETADVKQILSCYRIGELKQFTPLTAGSVQTNLLLHTSQGKWVLRYYKRDRSFNAVLFEVNLIAYLGRKGYPCPAVVRDSHGKLAGLYRDKAYALFEFIEGEHIEHPTTSRRDK